MEEKRKYPRLDAVAKIQFRKAHGLGGAKDAFVKDVSAEGFCFGSSEQLKHGDILEVEIIEPAMNESPICIKGQVAWSEMAPESDQNADQKVFLTGVKVLGIRKTDEARFAMLYCERLIAELKNYLRL